MGLCSRATGIIISGRQRPNELLLICDEGMLPYPTMNSEVQLLRYRTFDVKNVHIVPTLNKSCPKSSLRNN